MGHGRCLASLNSMLVCLFLGGTVGRKCIILQFSVFLFDRSSPTSIRSSEGDLDGKRIHGFY